MCSEAREFNDLIDSISMYDSQINYLTDNIVETQKFVIPHLLLSNSKATKWLAMKEHEFSQLSFGIYYQVT